MQLSDQSKEILSFIELLADEPITELQRRSGFRESTIRATIERLEEHGLLSRRCFLDLSKLGYVHHEFYFTFDQSNPGLRSKLVKRLLDLKGISWMGELGGNYHFGLNFCSGHPAELSQFFDTLCEDFDQLFIEKTLLIRNALSFFGRRYLSGKATQSTSESFRCLSYRATREVVSIDELDNKILHALTSVSYKSRRDLARQLSIPLSTLELRISRLKEKGVIVGFYYHLDASQIGMQTYLLFLSFKTTNAEMRARVQRFCELQPEVVCYLETVGSWDFELAVEVSSAQQVLILSDQIRKEFGPQLQSLSVNPSFGYRKVSEYPFGLAEPSNLGQADSIRVEHQERQQLGKVVALR